MSSSLRHLKSVRLFDLDKQEHVEVLSTGSGRSASIIPASRNSSKHTRLSELDLVRYDLSIAPGALARDFLDIHDVMVKKAG